MLSLFHPKEPKRKTKGAKRMQKQVINNKKPIGPRIRKYWQFYLLFIPVLAFVIVFHYLPMYGIVYGFTEYKVGQTPVFVGLDQFKKLFGIVASDASETTKMLAARKAQPFWLAFSNTIVFSVVKLLLNTGFAVIISIFLNEMISTKFKKITQTIIYLPHFMSWVVTASVFTLLLAVGQSGLVNNLVKSLGISDTSINFLAEPKQWKIWYYIINVWRETGWQTIIFMATLTGIDPGLYEAASIDGAGRWQKMCYVTFPALGNTIITVLILNLAKIMNLFESVFVLQNDAVRNATNVLQTLVYYEAFNSGAVPDLGYSVAIGLFRSIVGLVLMLLCNIASKKVRGRGIM